MKILVLQLARYGDIYQSWPALRALRRVWPEAEIALLVREKFAAATRGLGEVNRIVTLDTARILAPVLFNVEGIENALERIDELLKKVGSGYDRVINLSFSPLSSYLTEVFAGDTGLVTGYTRHADGSLCIPDDASAYFYAQVGQDRWNRVHLTDLFALVAGIDELRPEDWRPPALPSLRTPDAPYVVIQPGASDSRKTLRPSQWQDLVRTILAESDLSVVIVGAREEIRHYQWPDDSRLWNLMGSTELIETMTLLREAAAFVGPDSVGLHMSALTATPVFNISVGPVRFWETGPRSPGSRVWRLEDSAQFSLEKFWREFVAFREQSAASPEIYVSRAESGVAYSADQENEPDFAWRLTQALYMHSEYPRAEDRLLVTAFQRLSELCELALEQLELVKNPAARSISLSILDEEDTLLEKVCEFDPRVRPAVNWFLTQKLRLGPGTFEDVRVAMQKCFEEFLTVTRVYGLPVNWDENIARKDLTWKY